MAVKRNNITGMTDKEYRVIQDQLHNSYGYYMMLAGQLPMHKPTFEQRLRTEEGNQYRDRQRTYADLSVRWGKRLPREMWAV